MAAVVVKVQKNKNITLPTWLMSSLRLQVGDFIRLEATKAGVLIKPAKLIDPSQSYFWTKEWQAGERDADEDIKAGRVKRLRSVKELMTDLRS